MGEVHDYERGCDALCPFTGTACVTECMLMKPTVFGEPQCSLRVIADKLAYSDKGGGK